MIEIPGNGNGRKFIDLENDLFYKISPYVSYEYHNIKKLEKSDLYVDPEKVSLNNDILVMPYLKGKTLSDFINDCRFLDENDQ